MDTVITDLTLHFTDDTGQTSKIKVNRKLFVDACKSAHIDYFISLLTKYNKSESNYIEIQVPIASIMADIVMYIINGTWKSSTPYVVAQRIHSMDFLGMGTTAQFISLFAMEIDNKTFDLVHKFIDQKCYSNELYIKFMALKMPIDYDLTRFPKDLLKMIHDASWTNQIVLHNNCRIVIYNIDCRTYTPLVNKSNDNVKSVIVNPVIPIVAVEFTWHVVLYDLLTAKTICEIANWSDELGSVMCVRFNSSGELMYICRTKVIEVYDIHTLEIIKSHSLNTCAIRMDSSFDGRFVACLVPVNHPDYPVWLSKGLHIYDLVADRKIKTYRDSSKFGFISNSLLACTGGDQMPNSHYLFDCTTQDNYRVTVPLDLFEQKPIYDEYEERIYHSKRDIYITYLPFKNDKVKHDMTVRRGYNIVSKINIVDSEYKRFNSCFSHDGTRICTVMTGIKKSQLAVHLIDDGGLATFESSFEIDPEIMRYADGICHGRYQNSNMLAKIKSAISR